MKNILTFKRLVLPAALLACVLQFTVFGIEEEERELLRTLKRGVDDQIASVEFKCSYTYSEYVVDTLGSAFRYVGRPSRRSRDRLARENQIDVL